MLVAIAAVLLIGLIGLQGDGQRESEIVRLSGKSISFASLGVTVGLADGWSHLSISDPSRAQQPTLVNPAAGLIVRFHRFQFQSWPPSKDELIARGVNSQTVQSSEGDRPLPEAPIVRREYAHVSIDWIEVERHRTHGSGFLVGRLKEGNVDLMVTVMAHSEATEHDRSLQQLCDSIEIIGS